MLRLALTVLVLVVGCERSRTPSSGFVKETFGAKAIAFDEVYTGQGSGAFRSREVVVLTRRSPEQVLSQIAQRGGWRRLGGGIERQTDGLCASATAAEEYVAREPALRQSGTTTAAREHLESVVVSLLYC